MPKSLQASTILILTWMIHKSHFTSFIITRSCSRIRNPCARRPAARLARHAFPISSCQYETATHTNTQQTDYYYACSERARVHCVCVNCATLSSLLNGSAIMFDVRSTVRGVHDVHDTNTTNATDQKKKHDEHARCILRVSYTRRSLTLALAMRRVIFVRKLPVNLIE